MENIMLKKYEDERINIILKGMMKCATHDEEYAERFEIGSDFITLIDDIDKVIQYNKGIISVLRLNTNIWHVCQGALFDILEMYNLEPIGETSESMFVLPKNGIIDTGDSLIGKVADIVDLFKSKMIDNIRNIDLFGADFDCDGVELAQMEIDNALDLINGLYQDIITENIYKNTIVEIVENPMSGYNYEILESEER